eukprot:1158575-Amphidinium_carterae.1
MPILIPSYRWNGDSLGVARNPGERSEDQKPKKHAQEQDILGCSRNPASKQDGRETAGSVCHILCQQQTLKWNGMCETGRWHPGMCNSDWTAFNLRPMEQLQKTLKQTC